jgi:putative transcriptional regulator
MVVIVNLDVMLAKRKMSLIKLSQKVEISMPNLSILKKGKAKAICFTTLNAIGGARIKFTQIIQIVLINLNCLWANYLKRALFDDSLHSHI